MKQYMRLATLERTTQNRNEYGENIIAYLPIGSIKIFISFLNQSEQNTNQVLLDEWEYIGLTQSNDIRKGDRIDGKYEVKYILPSKPYNRIFMKEIN